MNGNRFVEAILRSRVHRLMSGNTLLIEVTGRKTGRKIGLPVNFIRIGSRELWILSMRDRTWWRNLRGGAHVNLFVAGRELNGIAEVVEDEAEISEMMLEYLRQIPLARKALNVEKTADGFNQEDIMRAAKERVMVRVLTKPSYTAIT